MGLRIRIPAGKMKAFAGNRLPVGADTGRTSRFPKITRRLPRKAVSSAKAAEYRFYFGVCGKLSALGLSEAFQDGRQVSGIDGLCLFLSVAQC
jgi:hypothetical protein